MNSSEIRAALSGRGAAETILAQAYETILAAEKAVLIDKEEAFKTAFLAAAKAIKDDAYHSHEDEWGDYGRYRYADYDKETEVEEVEGGFRFRRSGPEYCKGCYMGDPQTQRFIPSAFLDGTLSIVDYMEQRCNAIRKQMKATITAENARKRKAIADREAADRATFAALKARFEGSDAS